MDMSALARPVGPLPLWGWAALAGGGALLFLAKRGVPAASAVVNPNTVTPAAPTDPTAAAIAPQPVAPIAAGNTVYDPNTGQSSAPVTITDLLGGQSLSDFIGKLGPDYQNFTLNDGALGTSVTHAAQNQIDASTLQAQMQSNTDLLAIAAANYYGGDYTGASGTHYKNTLPADVLNAVDYYGGKYTGGDLNYQSGYTPFGLNPTYVAGAVH